MVSALLFVSLLLFWRLTRALVSDVPQINGPLPIIGAHHDISSYLKSRPSEFVHPGLWHTHEDLERMRTNVLDGTDPWKTYFDKFSRDQYSLANYTMQGPHSVLSRGGVSNYSSFTEDVRAAWQNSLMWYITRDDAHWERSTTILDAWGSNLTSIIGTDRSLMIGLEGDMFVNAAEIMRWEGNWTEAGAKWQGGSGFSVQLYWLFAGQSINIGQANYGMISIKALLSFAVYLEDVTMWNYAINAWINHPCAGVPAMYHPGTGQSVEAGRDQGHVQGGVGWSAYGAKVAQSQGFDLFKIEDHLLLKAAEYTAKYNLGHNVTFDPSWYRCEAVLVNGPWHTIAEENRGVTSNRPIWDLLYYEYAVKRGLQTPWVSQAREAEGFEGAYSNGPVRDEDPSWGGLIWAMERQ
ncbi:hypothetical protein KC318_g466 [Hortaea werneckii]|uniref:Alginate lyase domain-containing protein n=1 Tax=Hortaea werneckii TaxID=91943 RepID=A0A3M7A229_HORWE|nr:hypothetical protein KC334_g438 [Hortaea werneckii]KAI7027280.1 hypothetical protein KC355_g396 [Hortaea werneckii]KAI7676134.1 hypothetical protein KC318_g466 [Hortaea werneckii]RMY21644.1 hypothetical protein D0867_03213 [Hortaea werneckii]RMY37505.1 hypothetical protein D0866_03223 [Hortaea werneckii]